MAFSMSEAELDAVAEAADDRETWGIPIMGAIFTAQILSIGNDEAQAVLSGVTAAIWVNAGLCLLTAVVVGLFLRKPAISAD